MKFQEKYCNYAELDKYPIKFFWIWRIFRQKFKLFYAAVRSDEKLLTSDILFQKFSVIQRFSVSIRK